MNAPPTSMTRVVSFSSGHRYWNPAWSADENRDRFGKIASPYNHGHDYVLELRVSGEVDVPTGMLVNIKRIDDMLKSEIVARFHNRSLNDEVPDFQASPPTLENLISHIGETVRRTELPGGVNPRTLRLTESPLLWADYNFTTMQTTITRSYEFAAAHRLHAPMLSDEQNAELFGKCNHAAGHGHNYVLEVSVRGAVDPDTGMSVDLDALDTVVEREILERYDHRNLDVDIPELAGLPSTSENVAQAIFSRLRCAVPAELRRVRIWETARNAFDVGEL